jgi:DOPA 4,5-dioxygenase
VSRDHEVRNAWIGPSFPLDLSALPVQRETVPLQYPSLSPSPVYIASGTPDAHHPAELGYSSDAPQLSLEARRRLGATVERILEGEEEAAKAPLDLIS